jgi:acid phosphatase type 7
MTNERWAPARAGRVFPLRRADDGAKLHPVHVLPGEKVHGRRRRFFRVSGPVLLGSALSAWSAVAAASPRLVKGPYITGLTSVGGEVRFELDAVAPAAVELTLGAGDGGAAKRTVTDAAASMHVVRIAGLQPERAYDYTVVSGGTILGKGHLVTAPKEDAGQPVKFLLYGDDRSDETTHAAIVQALLATPSDFLVNTGDLVADGGSATDWEAFFRIEQPLLRDRALFLAIGNHELYDDQSGSSFAKYFGYADASGAPQPFGTVRWENARFFFLNGTHDWQGGPEREWLERALAQADGEPGLVWRIAVVHHSPWSSGPHGANLRLIEAHIPELLADHHVDLLLAGHDHIYERGDAGRLKYVISGGGGAPLYAIAHPTPTTRKAESAYHFIEVTLTGDAFRMVAHRLDGSTLDACGFSKGLPWDCDAKASGNAPAHVDAVAPAPPPPSPARCGCALPGSPSGGAGGVILALAAAALRTARRRRG